jgi:Zn finger protein HypA/HybF involved in hydrogenase expression
MSETDRYTSRCPVCDGLLELDENRGYCCPHCGWDESRELQYGDVWIVPDDRGNEDSLD